MINAINKILIKATQWPLFYKLSNYNNFINQRNELWKLIVWKYYFATKYDVLMLISS